MIQAAKRGARRVVGDRAIRRIKAARLRAAELLGSARWSRPGLNGLDVRLADHVNVSDGVFIEFGANDGLQQSNSYLLERERGWTGVLVEGVPQLAAECARNRPRARIVCATVTQPDAAGVPLGVAEQDLVGSVGASRVSAGAVTLSGIIDHVLGGVVPDLIVVDVEGHELPALRGLDLSRHEPRWILVETAQLAEVTSLLGDRYSSPVALSHHDYLFVTNS